MKWIGQHIISLIARFRSDVYLEDISTGTIASGAHLGLDSSNKIVKAADGGGDLTSIVAGTGLSGTSLTGPIPTLNVDASIPSITTLAGLTSFGAAGATTGIVAGDVTMYNAVNDGNPTISLGSSATNRLEMVSTYNSGAQTLDSVSFNSYTTSSTANDGRYFWRVDENQLMALLDAGLSVYGNIIAGADGASITSQNTTASSATEGGKLVLRCDDGAAMADNHRLGVVEFSGAEDASNNRQTGARIQAMCDAGWSASENGTRLEFYTMDGNASSELSLTLDSDLLATFAGGVSVTGTITGDVVGDLTGNADTVTTIAGLAPNTATTQASQPNITGVGTIGTGVWQGDAINATYLDGQSGTNTGDETLSSINALDITEVGTISSGQWRGDAIASAYIDGDAINGDKIADEAIDSEHYTDGSIDTGHIADDAVTQAKLADSINAAIAANTAKTTNRAYFEFRGFSTSDGTNYEMAELMTDPNAPFEHNTSTGSDGLTAQTIQTVMRSGGVVMPYTGVLKKFTGWATSAGSGTINIGLFKFTPTDDSAGNLTPVQLVNEQTTSSGNAIMNSFSETSSFDAGFTAGDIVYPAVLGISSKALYFNSTLEVEWS